MRTLIFPDRCTHWQPTMAGFSSITGRSIRETRRCLPPPVDLKPQDWKCSAAEYLTTSYRLESWYLVTATLSPFLFRKARADFPVPLPACKTGSRPAFSPLVATGYSDS